MRLETDLLRFEVYILIVLKDSRLSKTMKRAKTACVAKCFIANRNIFMAVYSRCVTGNILQNNSKGHCNRSPLTFGPLHVTIMLCLL